MGGSGALVVDVVAAVVSVVSVEVVADDVVGDEVEVINSLVVGAGAGPDPLSVTAGGGAVVLASDSVVDSGAVGPQAQRMKREEVRIC